MDSQSLNLVFEGNRKRKRQNGMRMCFTVSTVACDVLLPQFGWIVIEETQAIVSYFLKI